MRGHEVRPPNDVVRSYTQLAATVREAGLLARTRGFYLALLGGLCAGLAVLGGAFVLLGDSWFQLVVAGTLGVLLTQFAFLAHEAAHRQVFRSGPANDRMARAIATGVVGISYQWWMSKHSRHHANPNRRGKDPDIETDTVSFHEEGAAAQLGWRVWLTRHQGTLFFPLLLLEGLNLHLTSGRTLVARGPVKGRAREIAAIAARFAVYLTIVFWALPFGMAWAFLGVQLAVFGLYMGASFAPNHKGMPIVPADQKLDFFSKQVLTSRNISGGAWASAVLGGLNYQVEHHLFPSMPRPHLARARLLVREHCATYGVPYTETTLVRSYRIVVQYLNRVGLAAGRDPFACPLVAELRPR